MAHRVNARAAMTPARKKRIAGVLSRARDLMNDSGRHWIQGQLQGMKNGEKAYCSIGAIYASTKSETLRQEAVQVLEDVLPYNVAAWNDAGRTTWRDVDSKFREAIASLED